MQDIGPRPTSARQMDPDQMATIVIDAAASSRALPAGALAPAFRLRDHFGAQVSLHELTAGGPAIIHFYRGWWCTSCQGGLDDLAAANDEIRAAGGRPVAIAPPPSPELAQDAREIAARLPFPTLIDEGLKVATAYGVAYDLPEVLRPTYLQAGYAPPRTARAGKWLVPIPSTFLVNPNGRIVVSAVDPDYRNRRHGGEVITALVALRRRGTA